MHDVIALADVLNPVVVIEANPLTADPGVAFLDGHPGISGGGRRIFWSGTLADDLNEPHPYNWMEPGRAALAERLTSVDDAVRKSILLRPHARHVLSDMPSVRRWLDERDDDGIDAPGIALEPAALFEPGMIADAEDHLIRILEVLGPRVDLLIVSDADDTAPAVRRAPGDGALPGGIFGKLVAEHVPSSVPRVTIQHDPEAAAAWLTTGEPGTISA